MGKVGIGKDWLMRTGQGLADADGVRTGAFWIAQAWYGTVRLKR
jgi:hypothetical protein